MRRLLFPLAVLAAAPAAAQDFGSPALQAQVDELRQQQQMAQQRAIAQSNELRALEGQLRTEQTIRDIEAQRAAVYVPRLPYPQSGPPPMLDASRLPQIPDAALADSNRRVREVLRDRR